MNRNISRRIYKRDGLDINFCPTALSVIIFSSFEAGIASATQGFKREKYGIKCKLYIYTSENQ